MPRTELGRWGKLYASLAEDTAHFTDRQFRAYITTLCVAIRNRGELPKLAPLKALVGSSEVDFLVDEGRLSVSVSNAVTVTGWERYQAPVDSTNAVRQARFRDRHAPSVDAVDNGVTGALASNSHSIEEPSTTNEDHPVVDGGDHDALDRYYELTLVRPWGRNSGRWLGELQAAHGVSNVFAALEVEHRDDPKIETLLSRVAARLERQADRVAQAKRREPKPVDPLQAQIREALAAQEGPQTLVEPHGDPEEGRRAFEALRGSLGHRGGPLTPVGAVVSSLQNGSTGNGRSLTVDKGAGRKSAAAVPSGTESGIAPSLRRPATVAAEIYSRAEPGEPAPNRSEASTDEATKKEKAP